MIRQRLILVPGLLVLLLCTVPAWSADKHLLIGTWSIDTSTILNPNPPKGVTITLSEAADGAFNMSVDIVALDNTKSRAEGTFKPDGTAYPAKGSADLDTASMTMPSKRILVMGASMRGNPSNTRVFSLSDDGKQMIETIIGHVPGGEPYTRVHYWNRQ